MDLKFPAAFAFAALLIATFPASAQRRASADVEIKTVAQGKSSTVTKSVYCSGNGRLVTYYRTPYEYWHIVNSKGETQLYYPATKEVVSSIDPEDTSYEELLMVFLNGRIDDLGLGFFGYKVSGTGRDGEYLTKTFSSPNSSRPTVEIVYENYLPIYCCYTAPDGRTVSRKYLSDYKHFGRLVFPCRSTDISYGNKGDSLIVRTLYSNVQVDVSHPSFDFTVPADAKPYKPEQPVK